MTLSAAITLLLLVILALLLLVILALLGVVAGIFWIINPPRQ
jgi:hypothetical protein